MASCDYHKCEQCGGKAFYDANMSFDEDGGHWGAKIVALCRECAPYWDISITHKTPLSEDKPTEGHNEV